MILQRAWIKFILNHNSCHDLQSEMEADSLG
jgi:uncharacterized protein YecT (DUF1311 family)